MTSVGARLGLNEIPKISWKGKTFTQISSSLQLNTIPAARSIHNTMRARPVNHIRREIASRPSLTTGNPRISIRLDDLTGPNGYLVSQTTSCSGNQSMLDFNLTSNSTEKPGVCQTAATCMANNALKRVRSAGMVKKNYNINRNNDHYCTSAQEYMVSRNKTYQQNQYAYIRQGNANAVPGTGLSSNNIYSAGGLSHCALVSISTALGNNTFVYQWIDGNDFTVTIPDATNYDIGMVNGILASTLVANNHYFVNNITGAKVVTMAMVYDTFTGKIQLQTFAINTTTFGTGSGYSLPSGATWGAQIPNPSTTGTKFSQFRIPNTSFPNTIGFSVANYPPIADISGNIPNKTFVSSFSGSLLPNYVAANYKPNNPTFGVQGAVDGGAYIDRVRFNTITNAAASTSSVWGNQTANALAYGVNPSGEQLTAKLKYGIPTPVTPTFNPRTGEMSRCQVRMIKGG
jgi:hypothetical protein